MDRVDYESIVLQDLLAAYERDELDISPWYQRRAVWTTAHKAYLINSIFERMPVPTLYIRHKLDLEREVTVKEVVDGQQRIRSIIDYRSGGFTARHPEHSRRIHYSELTTTQRHSFLMTALPVGYLIGADDRDVIEIFGRLNAVSKTLNAQEKRAAKFSGEFHQFCLRESVDRLPIWRALNVFTAANISRMAEVQFVAELVIAMVEGVQDYSAPKIDAAYERWDDEFPHRDDVAGRLERCFAAVTALSPEDISDTIFSRSPILYSLLLVLDQRTRLPSVKNLHEAIWEIDERFNDDRPASQRPEADVEFYNACTSSTQRIRTRRTRMEYIGSFVP